MFNHLVNIFKYLITALVDGHSAVPIVFANDWKVTYARTNIQNLVLGTGGDR